MEIRVQFWKNAWKDALINYRAFWPLHIIYIIIYIYNPQGALFFYNELCHFMVNSTMDWPS